MKKTGRIPRGMPQRFELFERLLSVAEVAEIVVRKSIEKESAGMARVLFKGRCRVHPSLLPLSVLNLYPSHLEVGSKAVRTNLKRLLKSLARCIAVLQSHLHFAQQTPRCSESRIDFKRIFKLRGCATKVRFIACQFGAGLLERLDSFGRSRQQFSVDDGRARLLLGASNEDFSYVGWIEVV